MFESKKWSYEMYIESDMILWNPYRNGSYIILLNNIAVYYNIYNLRGTISLIEIS